MFLFTRVGVDGGDVAKGRVIVKHEDQERDEVLWRRVCDDEFRNAGLKFVSSGFVEKKGEVRWPRAL